MRELFNEIRWRDHFLVLTQLGVAALVLFAVVGFFLDRRSEFERAERVYLGQLSSNQEAVDAERLLQGYIEPYRQLREQGLVGEPRRLQWVETLREIARESDITGIQFTLESNEVIDEFDPLWHPSLATRATNMRVTLRLAHEGELYHLFNELQRRAPGLFSIEECELGWFAEYGDEYAFSRLRGTCDLRWYTVVDVAEALNEA